MSITISPSIIAADILDFNNDLKILEKENDFWLHLDIMDGHFVPNLTFGGFLIQQISNKSKIPLDAHLMVKNPTFFVDDFIKNKIKLHNITVHVESVIHLDRLLRDIKTHFPSVGLSLNPSTNLEILPNYIYHLVDLILIMTVNPGFAGQKYIEEMNDKIFQLINKRKILKANFKIQVDGGINNENAVHLKALGVDNLVVGNYFFKGAKESSSLENFYKEKINSLR
jgi:ribulose-phosphate 3-epimerase